MGVHVDRGRAAPGPARTPPRPAPRGPDLSRAQSASRARRRHRGDTGRMTGRIRTAVRVEGIVQGVGFRPVRLRAGHPPRARRAGRQRHRRGVRRGRGRPGRPSTGSWSRWSGEAPPLARDRAGHDRGELPPRGSTAFAIVAEPRGGRRGRRLVSRRHRHVRRLPGRAGRSRPTAGSGYPFINCTNCGPAVHHRPRRALRPGRDDHGRLRDVRGLRRRVPRSRRPPLPRPAGLLPGLRPAARCSSTAAGPAAPGDPIAAAAALLRAGQVLAVKGLGGYHLAARRRGRARPSPPCAPASTARTSRSR